MAMSARKIVLGFLCLVIACLGTSHVRAQTIQGLDAIRVASGLTSPLFTTAPPGDFNRLFIVQQNGQIRILKLATGALNSTPFLTVSDVVSGGEQGLLGLAFDPSYATNGKFYVNYTAAGGAFNAGITKIVQYQVSSNPDIADTTPANIKTLLSFNQPETNHNGGWIGFSLRPNDSDNLYIATGDGGAGNDQGTGHIEPGGNAQNTTTLLGKMLRIHVNPAAGTYTIPSSNPFFGSTTSKQEIWLFGLRNPFRDSFDRSNGRMYIGDVGQDTREEIDVQQATNPGGGENYGWRLREGTIATPTGNPVVGGPPPPGNVDPILDYPHTTGQTVIGGYVYRGNQIPALQGTYVFADYLGPEGGSAGRIFTLNYNGTSASNFQDITSQLFPIPLGNGTANLQNPSSLGEDAKGELYITDIGNGNVYKLSPMLVAAASRKTHNNTGTFDVNLPLTGAPGIECRSGGANGDYTMVFKFALPLTSVRSKSLQDGTGQISSAAINSNDAHEYIVNLTGVTNAQYITVNLTNVIDSAGNLASTVSASMGILLGDVDQSGRVDGNDVSAVQSHTRQTTDSNNYPYDINETGQIDGNDVSATQAHTRTQLPPPPQSGGRISPVPTQHLR